MVWLLHAASALAHRECRYYTILEVALNLAKPFKDRMGHMIRKLLALGLSAVVLAGCASQAPAVRQDELPGAGGSIPEAAVEGFFEDLNRALADPSLGDDETRERWAETLAGYFAPSERIRQRAALARTLDAFLVSVDKAAAEGQPDEQTLVTLEIQPQPVMVRTLRQQATRAEVELVDARLYLKIMRVQGDRQRVIWEQTEPLQQLIGRQDGSVPLVRIDGRWFLSSS